VEKEIIIMREITLAILFLTCLVVSAQDSALMYNLPPFLPVCPSVVAKGEAFTAEAKGFDSLFYNPAGFANGDNSLTFLAASPWVYTDPLTQILLFNKDMDSKEIEDILFNEIFSGGYGSGFSGAIGLVKNGLGIGAAFISDSHISGDKQISDVRGEVHMTLGFVLGYAYTFSLSGIEISIGADIKPMARIYVPLSNTLALSMLENYTSKDEVSLFELLSEANALYGLGIGFDSGIIIRFGALKFGASIMDIGNTLFYFKSNSLKTIMDSLYNSGIFPPEGTSIKEKYSIPMNISIGAAFNPDMGSIKSIIDPNFYIDFRDITSLLFDQENPLFILHIGIETRLANLFTLYGGYSKGLFSFGCGISLLFFDISAAVFTQNLTKNENPKSDFGSVAGLSIKLNL